MSTSLGAKEGSLIGHVYNRVSLLSDLRVPGASHDHIALVFVGCEEDCVAARRYLDYTTEYGSLPRFRIDQQLF